MQQPDHSGLMQQLHALQKQLEDKQRREEFLKVGDRGTEIRG